MSIANIGLANHAIELDLATPPFLLDILQHVVTMHQVHGHGYDDHISSDKEGNQEEHKSNNVTCMVSGTNDDETSGNANNDVADNEDDEYWFSVDDIAEDQDIDANSCNEEEENAEEDN
eukprot:14515143-Ditylum_brightwellii.AAC.1